MSKNLQAVVSFVILLVAFFWNFEGARPPDKLEKEIPLSEFSTARAFVHVNNMAQEPHHVGSAAHSRVRNYIVSQLEEMGLLVQTQETFYVNKYGTFTRPQNILAKIEGSGDGQALVLMSHYDSAMHSSYGASDAASGVATILEGVRAYLASGQVPENDIIILFTDAEELGLNGAGIFVEEHPWAEDVGMALNFESRGSGGSSAMLLETNNGNRVLVEKFMEAGVDYPFTSSLYYSIYKMLPNDTDLTVLREQGDINGFNFAFIDDHFDYHTATDVPENLDPETLAHQGSYLMPLLYYFSNVPLEDLNAEEDLVFFNFPLLEMVSYPFSWIMPMWIVAVVLFSGIIFYGFRKDKISIKGAVKGFLPLLISLILAGGLGYGLWELLLLLYPGYGEMEHGFTYNGYYYIAAFIFLAAGICFYIYHKFRKNSTLQDLFVAPLILWLLVSLLMALYLKGAAYLIIPVYLGLIQLGILIWRPKFSVLLLTLLSLPLIFIFTPLVDSLPVALGLKVLFVSAILAVLLWTLLWPVFGFYKNQLLGFLSISTFIILMLIAHFQSDFSEVRPKPNSLVYLMDEDTGVATWNTYDEVLDAYTEPYFQDSAAPPVEVPEFSSKYNSGFKRSALAPKVDLPSPYINIERVAAEVPGKDAYQLKIAPNREISRIELFADKAVDFSQFEVNGKTAPELQPGRSDLHVFKNRWNNRLLTYYAINKDTLRIDLAVEQGQHPKITLFEAAYDLQERSELSPAPRTEEMIPRPFVLNDASVIKKSFVIE